jgi:hypothetical protein
MDGEATPQAWLSVWLGPCAPDRAGKKICGYGNSYYGLERTCGSYRKMKGVPFANWITFYRKYQVNGSDTVAAGHLAIAICSVPFIIWQ